MQRQFKQIIIKFYETITQKKRMSVLFKRSLQRYLNYVQLEDQKNKQKQKDSEQIRSLKSAKSNLSTDSYTKIIKLFHSARLQTSIVFAYFLQILKTKRKQGLTHVLQLVSQKLKTCGKNIGSDVKKLFQLKFNKFNEQLTFLNSKILNHCKIDWLYFQSFSGFEGECLLLTQLLSSNGQELQSLQKIKINDYATFLTRLSIKCHISDRQSRESKVIGNGDIKIFIGKRGDYFYILNQKQFQVNQRLNEKEVYSPRHRKEVQSSDLKQLKKYPTIKLKEQFLTQMGKLKQDYEFNTSKIASLFNFKDSSEGSKLVDDSRQA